MGKISHGEDIILVGVPCARPTLPAPSALPASLAMARRVAPAFASRPARVPRPFAAKAATIPRPLPAFTRPAALPGQLEAGGGGGGAVPGDVHVGAVGRAPPVAVGARASTGPAPLAGAVAVPGRGRGRALLAAVTAAALLERALALQAASRGLAVAAAEACDRGRLVPRGPDHGGGLERPARMNDKGGVRRRRRQTWARRARRRGREERVVREAVGAAAGLGLG
mmetsp:Transcript_53420/g.141649  ORF Transcript_53420/g.141649 Transcript_53420/m.141649 type:complete len:225 (+) Transcript_53420:308-982(+)